MPSTIEEDDSNQQFTTFESLGEKSGGTLETVEDPGKFRLSKFSFMSNATQESTPEEIEQARTSFRQSMTGNFTRRDTRRATNMTMGTVISDITEADTEADDVADSIADMSEFHDKEMDNVNILDELKHEIMVNYLFQQQCARLWIADGTGEVEGVMLRKSRGNYLACPPALADSVFADSCVELNVQVSKQMPQTSE